MRLTEKGKFSELYDTKSATACINKLGQLEDIEEKLGIDLITLFKMLKRKRIYSVNKYDNKIQQMIMYGECDLTGIFVYEKGFEYPECAKHLLYKDYGKTWALTKEELL